MSVEYPVALARADKNLKKDIHWISVSAVGMFLGSPTDIQRIGPMSEIDIFWTSTGLTCVMWEEHDLCHIPVLPCLNDHLSRCPALPCGTVSVPSVDSLGSSVVCDPF
jgi:hypothetical protein